MPLSRYLKHKLAFFSTISTNNKVSNTIEGAKGSNLKILLIDVILLRQTMQTFKEGQLNELSNNIYDAYNKSKTKLFQINKIITKETIYQLGAIV